MQHIYMDANSTTPLLPAVLDAMRPFWLEHYGNASSIHQRGQYARAAVDQARESVARLLNCRAAEIVFTSGGTESDNMALFGVLSPGDHLITTTIEHNAILNAAQELSERGIEVTYIPCNAQGLVEVATLEAAMQPNTKLVSVMYANNETGVIQPVREMAAVAHAGGALFHTDAIQAAGKLPLDMKELGCDLLSISGHKIYAPKGTGALFVRKNVLLKPLMFGGRHERGRRPGTENVAGIVGLGKACELARAWLASTDPADSPAALTALRDRLEQGILAAVEDAGVNGAGVPRVANTCNLYFDYVEAEALVIALDLKGLAVSGGSACLSGATEPSHVLVAMGLNDARARGSLRFSLSRLTTQAEVDAALAIVPTAVGRLRELSPKKLAMASSA
jgi:cysteine desulfurase